jgi:hypothetical protein
LAIPEIGIQLQAQHQQQQPQQQQASRFVTDQRLLKMATFRLPSQNNKEYGESNSSDSELDVGAAKIQRKLKLFSGISSGTVPDGMFAPRFQPGGLSMIQDRLAPVDHQQFLVRMWKEKSVFVCE